MMPLLLADVDKEYTIQKVGGSAEVKKHLENLGFCAGGKITVVNTINGNMIVKVKDARVALNDEMARKIMI